jgi:hypothetical protein
VNIFRNLLLQGGRSPADFQGFIAPDWPPADITNLLSPFDSAHCLDLCFLPMVGGAREAKMLSLPANPKNQILITRKFFSLPVEMHDIIVSFLS